MPNLEVKIPPKGKKAVYLYGLRVFVKDETLFIADEKKLHRIKDVSTQKFFLRYLKKNPRFKGIDDKFGI